MAFDESGMFSRQPLAFARSDAKDVRGFVPKKIWGDAGGAFLRLRDRHKRRRQLFSVAFPKIDRRASWRPILVQRNQKADFLAGIAIRWDSFAIRHAVLRARKRR